MEELEFLTPVELAQLIKLPTQTLANWRSQGSGPPYTKVGNSVRYVVSDVKAWSTAERRDPSKRGAA